MSELSVRPITAEAAHPLRGALTPEASLTSSSFEGDAAEDTLHLGGFLEGRLVAVASVFRKNRPEVGFDGGHQLRGLVVEASHRGRGFGARLVEDCAERVRERGGTELWGYVPPPAAGFFSQQGFDTEGPPELLGSQGPHFLMRLHLG